MKRFYLWNIETACIDTKDFNKILERPLKYEGLVNKMLMKYFVDFDSSLEIYDSRPNKVPFLNNP